MKHCIEMHNSNGIKKVNDKKRNVLIGTISKKTVLEKGSVATFKLTTPIQVYSNVSSGKN